MGLLTIFDSGRSDCTVISTGQGNNRKIVVLDGGTKEYNGKAVLYDYLKEKEIGIIDLLIITHVHQDHFGGFAHIVNRIPVRQAILPYDRNIILNEESMVHFNREDCFDVYYDLYQWLLKCGADTMAAYDAFKKDFSIGEDTILKCLYPNKRGENAFWIDSLCSPFTEKEEIQKAVDGFRNSCNHSSSIWSMEKKGEIVALFSGDSTINSMNEALLSLQNRPRMLKLSHHGINSDYFSPEQVSKISPKQDIVICNSETYYNIIKKQVEEACSVVNITPHYTFSGNYLMEF